ncbi:MAG: cation transporter [Uliginosibacterium sp.]|nr:cation transporter [Uliginosibacterium sp.]
MSECGCEERCRNPSGGNGYRRVLVVALVMNLALFFVEIAGAWSSGSVSLLADAIDFLGDSVNFGASLLALGMAMVWSSRLALAKGIVMSSWGVMVLARAIWAFSDGGVPVHETMTWISLLALATNLAVALLLYRHRAGDANRKSVWLCARNDAFANVAVLAAAQGVAFTGQGWPDLVAASVMAGLGLNSGLAVVRRARRELGERG